MNKNIMRLLIACALAIIIVSGLVAFGMWRYNKYRHLPPPAHAVLLRDRSDSGLGSCDNLAAMGRELLASSLFAAGSTIAIMETGDNSTAGEPVLLDVLEVPVTQRVIEGRSRNAQRQQELLDQIKVRCEEAGQTNQSPIYMAIRRAIEHLRARGCDGRSNCILYVQSDLEEMSERRIRELLNQTPQPVRRTSSIVPQLPTPINNAGINVRICGLSETVGTVEVGSDRRRTFTPMHDAQRADRIRQVWEGLFSDPQHVIFNSHCPRN